MLKTNTFSLWIEQIGLISTDFWTDTFPFHFLLLYGFDA